LVTRPGFNFLINPMAIGNLEQLARAEVHPDLDLLIRPWSTVLLA